MDDSRLSGECLGGEYLWMSDLIVVRSLEPARVATIVEALMQSDELKGAMTLVDHDEE
jgi:hypothetical protein